MTTLEIRAMQTLDQRRVVCDCGRAKHDERCALTRAWGRALRQAESELRREQEARRTMYAVAV